MSDVGAAKKIAILRKHPLFVHMRDWDLERLATHARIDRAPAGTKLFSKDEPGRSMIMVINGYIMAYSMSDEGREVAFDIFGPDEICGEIALLDGRFRSADAKVLKDAEYLVLDHDHFIPFLKASPEACLEIITILCSRLRATTSRVEDTAFLELRARLAKKLLAFAEHFGELMDSGAVRIGIALNQSELGAMVDVGRESVNRQLSVWARDGLIAIDSGEIEILDVKRLEEETHPQQG